VVLVKPQMWERYGLEHWIGAAQKRLHHNVLAIALANKLARIAWAVLAKGRNFEFSKTTDVGSDRALISMMARSNELLQSEAGYIDARPTYRIDEISCDARPDHTMGHEQRLNGVHSSSA
jgi:hypothetical protein